ncbi:winged helix-turn-helix domain-containing protein [Streptomyces sp. SBT349]|uniref:winged helix-turn-helix domain-containing protein n=1 Tax=Streptomyces sp. SBT349 TaxID=1580539 RepID=UPI000D14AA11|nr:winged helix-turn-helix domain-containing protein [Streptomyces sp. SBT349]
MRLADDDPRPKAVQIADILRGAINDKREGYQPGNRLPTRKQLSEEFGVASQTVQNGLEILRAEGLIFSAGNRGVFVSAEGSRNENIRDEIIEMRSQIARLTERVTVLEEGSRVSDS